MSISRRGFFGLLGAGAALVAAPELAELLVPKRTIFLPPKGGWLPFPFNKIRSSGFSQEAFIYSDGLWVVEKTTTELWTHDHLAGVQWPIIGDLVTIEGVNSPSPKLFS